MPRAKTNVSPVLARPSPGMSLAEHVHSELKKALQSGRFEPGERMREAAIADLLQVSRTPVREALRRLVSDNLLVSGERGIVVPQMTQSQIMELYAMREVLEGAAAAMAAQHASAAEIDYLNSLLREEVAAGEDPHRLADINVEMHRCIYRAANNQYLARLLRSVQDEINQLRGTTFSLPGRAKLGLAEHRAIVRAIESKDQDAAEKAARHHIREGLRARLQLIRRETQSRS